MNKVPLDEIRKAQSRINGSQEELYATDDGVTPMDKQFISETLTLCDQAIRSLLEENERQRVDSEARYQFDKERTIGLESQLQQLREELEQERYNHELTKEELFYEKRATAEVHESLTLRDSANGTTE